MKDLMKRYLCNFAQKLLILLCSFQENFTASLKNDDVNIIVWMASYELLVLCHSTSLLVKKITCVVVNMLYAHVLKNEKDSN